MSIQTKSSSTLALTRRHLLAGATAAGTCLTLGRARAETIGTIIVGSNGWLFPTWEKVKQAYLPVVDQTTPVIAGVVSQLKAAGIDVAITLIPMRARIYPQFLPSDAQIEPDAMKRYSYGRDQLIAKGVLVPDLAALFTAQAKLPAPADSAPADPSFVPVGADLFFKADSHWATPASLPAADQVASEIMSTFQLPTAPGPGTVLGAPTESLQEKNDLAELLPDPSKYPFESYMLPAVAGASGDDALIATDAADTIVIGNSYMQPKYGFSSELSAKLNRPVSLFWKIDRFGPYATLIEYMQSSLFKQQRPKLIVWNIRETQLEHLPTDDDFYGTNAISPADITAAIKAALG